MSFPNDPISFQPSVAEHRISRLGLWLDQEKTSLSQRGEAGCLHCLNAVTSLDVGSFESPVIPNSATLRGDLDEAGQQMNHLMAMILQAREALSTCIQCSRFPRCDDPVLRVTGHPLNLSAIPPQPLGYAPAEQIGIGNSMPALGTEHSSHPTQQLPSTQISLPFPPPQIHLGTAGSLSTTTSLASNVQTETPSDHALDLPSCARVDQGLIKTLFESRRGTRAKKVKTMLDQVLNHHIICLTWPKFNWATFNDPEPNPCASVTTGYLASKMAKQITLGFAKKMTRPPRMIEEHERFLLICLCKVLKSMNVSVYRIMQLFASREKLSIQTLEGYLQGVVWANQLLEGLYFHGWGHQAVDLLLLWDLKVSSLYLLKQGGEELHNCLFEELAKPEYRNKFSSVPGRLNKSLPSVVQATLQYNVSYRDVCLALGYTPQYVEATEDRQDSTPPTFSLVNDIRNSIVSACDSVEDISEGARHTGGSRQGQRPPAAGIRESFATSDMPVDTEQSEPYEYNKRQALGFEEWLANDCSIPEKFMDHTW